MIKLYNSLTRKKENFISLKKNQVGLYTCGPTVYDFAHIGNLRTYIFEDVLRRTLEANGFKVKHVMNITDVGHLTSNADAGEDKVERKARFEKKTISSIVRFYTQAFLKDLEKLNVRKPDILAPASHYINEQIKIIKKLTDRGLAYETSEAVYFDLRKWKKYNPFSHQPQEEKIKGARKEVITDPEKRHPADFALWFKLVGRFKNHILRWPSPWGEGFPGWHIECSAISSKFLGQPFDIHCGGIDHLTLHHPNEIAQSEGAFGKPLAKFWLHGEFLLINKGRMGKSEGNLKLLSDLEEKGFNPLSFRYLVFLAHWRSKLNFTWESLKAAQQALNKIYEITAQLGTPKVGCAEFEREFQKALNNNLDTPAALRIMWELLKSKYPPGAKKRTLLKFDKILGLGLDKIKRKKLVISQEVKSLLQQREEARKKGDFKLADNLREKIGALGFEVQDTKEGPKLKELA